jgi:hypothetical protein
MSKSIVPGRCISFDSKKGNSILVFIGKKLLQLHGIQTILTWPLQYYLPYEIVLDKEVGVSEFKIIVVISTKRLIDKRFVATLGQCNMFFN